MEKWNSIKWTVSVAAVQTYFQKTWQCTFYVICFIDVRSFFSSAFPHAAPPGKWLLILLRSACVCWKILTNLNNHKVSFIVL